MITRFMTLAVRRMMRSKAATFVQIVGLSLGIACTLMIAVLLRYESGFDLHHAKGDRLYRIVTDELRLDRRSPSGGSPGALADALMSDVAGVEVATTVFHDVAGLFTVTRGDAQAKFDITEGVARAMPEFLSMFDIPILHGSGEALREPGTMLLSREIAVRFFGDEEPLGKVVRVNNQKDYRVVGVYADPPKQTHISYTILLSGASLRTDEEWMYDWGNLSTNVQTYALLRTGMLPDEVERQTDAFIDRYMLDEIDKKKFHVQPVSDIHLEPEYADGAGRAVSRESLSALGFVGLFLLLTACVNFVNMATAQATNRAREVGVRKVLGAVPGSISAQFLAETFLTVLMSTVVAAVLVEAFFPLLTAKIGVEASFGLLEPETMLTLTGLAVLMTLLSGLYPSFVLRGFLPVSALKRTVSSGGRVLRKGLVVLQFIISQLLLVALIVVTLQLKFVRERDMGLRSDGVVVVPIPVSESGRLNTFRAQLASHPGISSVSFSWSSAISGNLWDANIRFNDGKEERIMPTDLKFADEHYFETYGLSLISGQNYRQSDTVREYVVNERFVRSMGIQRPEEAVGKLIRLGTSRPYLPIVGVVRDFNGASLHTPIRPTLLAARVTSYCEAGIKVASAGLSEHMAFIEKAWTEVFPEYVFSSEFLDDRIASLYEQERRVEFLFSVFTTIAIVIGCIGLVGLVAFVTERRTKEIGVRKVLGASTVSILGLITKEFAQLIAVAFVVAAPVAYVVMTNWLERFAFRIDIGPAVFLATIGITTFIAALTIGFRALNAARANPVENLRYE